ncbi:MAG: restriction endonuclease subunit S [Oscillospiraceae bacterium]
MSDWKTKTLGEVTSYIAKGVPPKYVEEASDDTIYVLNQKCNRNFRISYDDSRLHNNAAKKVPDIKMLKPGDVLINSTGTGTAGRVAQIWNVKAPTTIDGHMILMRPTDEIDSLYYGYAIKAFQAVIESYAEGSTGQTEINKTRLQNETIIAYPTDKGEQSKIARILAAIDEKLLLNEEVNKNLEQQAEAIFQSILSNAITTVNLGEIADVKGGKRLPKGVNLIDIPNTHPYIRVRDLNNVLFASLTPDYAYVDEETQKSISRYIVSTGDVLISIVGTIGLTAIVDSTLDKANLTENCVKVTNLKHITPEYLLLYLRSQLGREAITKGTVGAVQQKLPIKNIQAIPIPLLSEKDKNTLFCTLDSIFAEISSNVIQSAKLSSLRDTLLPRLMSGELDASNIDL